MRTLILLFFYSLIFKCSFAQTKIRESNGLFGIYNEKSKKWEVPATYTSIKFLPQNIYSSYNFDPPVCLLATNKNGTIILDAKTFKNKSNLFKEVKFTDEKGSQLIVSDKDSLYYYSIYSGISNSIGGFNSYRFFTSYDMYGSSSYIYAFKKGDKTCIYSSNSYPQLSYFNGDVIELFDSQYYLIKQNGKFGVTDNQRKIIIPNVYDTIINTSYYLDKLIVKKQNKWGMINNNDSIILSIKYEGIDDRIINYIEKFIEDTMNIYPVKLNGKWGIIDKKENVILDYQYDSIIEYIHPLKFKMQNNGNTGLVDIKGNILFPFIYKYFEPSNHFSMEPQKQTFYFVNNTCKECKPLEIEGGWGFADSTGKLLHEMKATLIPLRNSNKHMYENFDSTNFGFLWNVGGQKIKELIEVDSVTEARINEDGGEYFVPVAVNIYSYILKGGKTGIISNNGTVILPIENDDLILPLYRDNVELFEARGLTTLSIKNNAYKERYLINTTKQILVNKNGKWGVANINGNIAIPPIFDSIEEYIIDRYSICEVVDSIQATLNFPLEQYKCWKDNNIYFYKKNGAFLSKRLHQEQAIGDLNFTLNPPNKENFFYTPIYNLIAINPIHEFHRVINEIENEEIDELGNTYLAHKKYETLYYTPTTNKFNFFNPLNNKYLFDDLIEDFIILTDKYDRGIQGFQWSNTNDRIKIVSNYRDYNSTVEKIEANKINDFTPNNIQQSLGRYDSIMFAKQNNKWYLRNLNETHFKNKIGFDSIHVNSSNTFTGYTNSAFATYSFNEQNFDKIKIDIVFPEYATIRLACSGCEYKNIEKKTKTPQLLFDENGNEIQGDTINSITKIPLITKGKLNITYNYSTPILENWVDEIIFPSNYNVYHNTNLSDTNDYLFKQELIYDHDLSNISNAKTIAYRIGTNWYITTIHEEKKQIGPFDSIKNANYTWMCTKANETKSFSTTDLKQE